MAAVMLAAAAACNGHDPRRAQAANAPPPAALDAMPVSHAPGAPGTGSSAIADDGEPGVPAPELDAFGGRLPALPMLSADGQIAAIDVSEGLGMSSFHTYEVAFVAAGGRERERMAVVDRALAKAMMADAGRAGGKPAMKLPSQRLARAAAKITQRLATFTPFAREFDVDAIGRAGDQLALGSATLLIHADEAAGLELRLVGDGGAVLRRDRIPVRRRQFADRDGGRCGGQPRLTGVWWEPARRRAVLQIIFPGHDSCDDEPTLWLVW
jgi:hypothetical protein